MTKRTTWTPADDRQLRAMVREGLTQNQMGEALGRSARGVGFRMELLGIKTTRPRVFKDELGAPIAGGDEWQTELADACKMLLARLIERGYWREAA